MKTVYICGDSFNTPDPEYGACWVDLLSNDIIVVNLSQVSSTNLLISRQIDVALAAHPDFIIVSFTSCTRGEKRHNNQLVPFSYHTASTTTTPFDQTDLDCLKNYFTRFFDLELSIYQNSITIAHTLHKLVTANIPFLFDQGGFEHASYCSQPTRYFQQFDQYRSGISIWDYAGSRDYRPYFHITDSAISKKISDYYNTEIKQHA